MPSETLPIVVPRRPEWNKGRIVGQNRPLAPKHVRSIRVDMRWLTTGAISHWSACPTGFAMSLFGDLELSVHGQPIDFTAAVTCRGMMFAGLPNLAWVYAYFRSAWTQRVDLVEGFVCRLIHHMQDKGAKRVTPTLRPEDADMPLLPWLDEEDINAGYLLRGRHLMPKRGNKPEWQLSGRPDGRSADFSNPRS